MQESQKLLIVYLAFLRAIYLIHQNNHWIASDYGEHLLFERLYNEVANIADNTAEKILGLFEALPEHSDIINGLAKKYNAKNFGDCPITSSLNAVKDFLMVSEKVYQKISKLSLGVDDLIMSNHNDIETHKYLLLQSAK